MPLPHFGRPFSAGSAAEFHPGSLAIDFGMSKAGVLDLNAGQALLNALNQAKQSDLRSTVFQELPWDTKNFFALRAHEQDHLRRMISTTYGFFSDSLRCLWLSLMGRWIQEESERDPGFLLSRLRLPQTSALRFDEAIQHLQSYSHNHSHTATLVSGIPYLLKGLTDPSNPSELACALWALSNGRAELAQRLYVDYYEKHNVPHDIRITARHLLEFFAIGEHANGFLRTGSHVREVTELMLSAQQEYALIIRVWRGIFGAFDCGDPDLIPRHEDDVIFDSYLIYPFELLIAADLALWVPYFPADDLSINGELNWTDVDPGHRFLRIMQVMKSMSIPQSVIPTIGRNEHMRELQESVCDALNWPTPDYLAQRWLEHLTACQRDLSSPWAILDGSSTYRIDNAIRLLSIRGARPADLILNNHDFTGAGVEASPIWLLQDSPTEYSVVSMSQNDDSALTPLIMIEGCRHLIDRDRPLMTPLYGIDFRLNAVRVLTQQLAQHCGWTDALRDRFLVELLRVVGLNHFFS